MSAPALDRDDQEWRNPLTRYSQVRGQKSLYSTRNYHAIHNERSNVMYLCGCAPQVRGVDGIPSRLGPRRRKDKRWAESYRWRI